MRVKILGQVMTAALLVSVCGSATKAETLPELNSYLSQSVTWQKCPEDYFLNADYQAKTFSKASADCATVNVPAIYSGSQTLPDFKIEMMRQPATGVTKLGTLFINPGGPGESGIEELQGADFPAELRANYDIVGFDPRGVNRSAPVIGKQIMCRTKDDYETYWKAESSPANDKEYLQGLELSNKYYQNCAKDNPNWWTLSTKNVVSDLEIMRKVVTNDQPLNFLGSSYGTTIAAQYVTEYPQHVGHIILDSPTTNEADKPSSRIAEAKSLEANVMRLVKGYAKAKKMSVAAVKKLMLKVRQDGDDNKLQGFAGIKILDPKTEARLSNEYMFTHGIFVLTYLDLATAQTWFNRGLSEVSGKYHWNGNFEYLAMTMDGYDTDSLGGPKYDPTKIKRNNSYEIMDIVNAMDREFVDKSTPAQRRKLAKQLKSASPFWNQLTSDPSGYVYKGNKRWSDWTDLAKSDPNIPDPPTTAFIRKNESGKTLLVVGSKYESTTPYQFAVKTAKDLKSPLVTFTGTEHAPVASFANGCLNQVLIDYLVRDKPPTGPITCKK